MTDAFSTDDLTRQVDGFWDTEIVPAMMEFLRIPNESPNFDKDWDRNGHMQRAVELVVDWMKRQDVPGLTIRVHRDGERTPLILAEVAGNRSETVLMYGHLDKQPPMVGWREDLGPWKPMLDEQGRLYGRGAADDGYSVFAALAAVKALKDQGGQHGRIVMLIECSEESGSVDLPHYMNTYAQEIGEPDLVICLDSGSGNYEQLWSTTSLRGVVTASVRVEVLREGVHSGMAGGIVPNPMLVMRQLLNRLEDPRTGIVGPPQLKVPVPPVRVAQTRKAAEVLAGAVSSMYPFVEGARTLSDDPAQLLLNGTWEPALAVIGQEGLPSPERSGNVLIPELTFRISLRIPPTLPVEQAVNTLKTVLEADPPFGSRVTVSASGQPGWNAPELEPWLERATEASSREFFGKEAVYFGVGGSIPFMALLGEKFPRAQYLITGALGPHGNAHGPNEFLLVPFAKRFTCALTRILAAHHDHYARG